MYFCYCTGPREDISLGAQTKKWSGTTLTDQGSWSRWPIVPLSNLTHCVCYSVKTIKYAFFVCKISDLYRSTLSLGFYLRGFGVFCCFFHAWTRAVASAGCFSMCVCVFVSPMPYLKSFTSCLSDSWPSTESVCHRQIFSAVHSSHNRGRGEGKDSSQNVWGNVLGRCRISVQTECLLSLGQNDSLAQSPPWSK